MKFSSTTLVALLLAMALLSTPWASAAEGAKKRSHATQVVNLTPENYDEYVNPERYTFVLFCASWARECKPTELLWDRLSINQLKSRNREIFTAAKVDAKKYPQLAKKAGVNGYPTMIYYTPDDPEGIEYHGARELALLDSFVFQFT